MKRKEFLKYTGGLLAMATLNDLSAFANVFEKTEKRFPAFFIGHGSPMNGIENNDFSRNWQKIGKSYEKPNAILCISAHWLTRGTYVTAMDKPRTIHDFGGFPQELFQVEYPANGSLKLVNDTIATIHKTQINKDMQWGLDHGTWTILRHIYPDADIPVVQLSIDFNQPPTYHYELAKELSKLRNKGIMIIGSGNMVHNLGMVAWDRMNERNYGYDWAIEINETFKKLIIVGDHQSLINYSKLGRAAQNAIPSPDHYYPLLYVLAMQQRNEIPEFFNDECVAGSLTMTSVKII